VGAVVMVVSAGRRGRRGECGGGDSEVVKCGECVLEETSDVSAVVVVSAGRRGRVRWWRW
jgi:hypothetical protein